MKNSKGSSGVLVFIYVVLVIAVMLFLAIISTDHMKHAPCEDFSGYQLKNVPVRCLNELTK